MTPITTDEAARHPLTTDDEILARIDELVGRACRRQLWLMFLDADGVQLPLMLPMEDYPASPDGGNAASLAERLGDLVELVEAAHVLVVWERRLGEASTRGDRAWARALARESATLGVPLRMQLLSHRTGVRLLTDAEYVEE